jgi:hypothetical protein
MFSVSATLTEELRLNSLDTFTEEENMFRDSGMLIFVVTCVHDTDSNICLVKRFAVDVVGPKVREMDEKESMDPTIIQGLFEQGVSIQAIVLPKRTDTTP